MVSRASFWRRLLALLIAAAFAVRAAADDPPTESPADLHAAYQRLDADYRRELDHLSHVAYARSWSQLGDAARGWRPARPETGSLVFVAPDQYTAGANPSELAKPADDTRPWLDQFAELRRRQADALFELAKQAAEAGQLSLAFQWVTEAVHENPDHADARRLLGYEQRDGQWLTNYGAQVHEDGKTWHPKCGWIATADLPHYEAGQRLLRGRWRSAKDDANRRGDIKNGWQVRSDHFLVTTNHSLEAAAELAARLERLHQVWRQLFAGFYLSAPEVRELFAGKRDARTQGQPFRVFYHRDRRRYAAALRRRQPRIAETLGIYFDTDREAHFFAGGDQDGGTLYHEAVHQLFQESRPAAPQIGNSADFWIVEGVATYFETLSEHAGPHTGLYFTVGEATAGRLPAARARLQGAFYVPLDELTRYAKADVQRHPEIAKLYSQMAGLAAFLMDADQGRYREPLVRYLEAVYAGHGGGDSLAAATGASHQQLDAEYRRYMESLP